MKRSKISAPTEKNKQEYTFWKVVLQYPTHDKIIKNEGDNMDDYTVLDKLIGIEFNDIIFVPV